MRRFLCLRYFFFFLLLLLVLISLVQSHPDKSSHEAIASSLSLQQDSLAAWKKRQRPHQVIQVLETEVYSGDSWKGSLPSRWSTMDGNESSAPPPSILAPLGYDFDGDWKIVTSATRDQLGWEYLWNQGKPAMRRRTWLRTLSIPTPVTLSQEEEEEEEEETGIMTLPKRRLSSTGTDAATAMHRQSLLRTIQEDWNFKGFGWSFYKSLLFLQTCGISLRIPLSMNFEWCERNPAVPALTSSIAIYYPWTLAFFLNASLNVDWVKWALRMTIAHVHRLVLMIGIVMARAILLLLSVPLYPLTRQVAQPQWTLPSLPVASPHYSLDIQERVGISVSWRISKKRGYEYRLAYVHSYLPTILYLHSLWHQVLGKFQRTRLLVEDKKPHPLADWLRRRTGALGLSTGAPTPDPPYYTCNAIFNLSGFHYFHGKKKYKATKKSTSKVTTTLDETDDQLAAKRIEQDAVVQASSSTLSNNNNNNIKLAR